MTVKLIGKLLQMSSLFFFFPFDYLIQTNLFFLFLSLRVFPPIQNKCVRYWPDLHGSKEFGKVLVRNVDERPAQDYILRKLEVTRLDRVGKAACSIRADPLTWDRII